jgi:hypothetical protein
MSKERDLLARAGLVIAQHRWSHPHDPVLRKLSHQINAYFEENFEEIPEVTREPLSEEEMEKHNGMGSWLSFRAGVRFAEKYHGIGGKDE